MTTKKKNQVTGNKGGVNIPQLIKAMDFCWVINDKKLKGSGLSKGDILLVSGTRVVPASQKDPYLQRVLCVGMLVKDDKICVPKDDNDYKAFLVDPRNLAKVDEETSKWATNLLNDQYGEAT